MKTFLFLAMTLVSSSLAMAKPTYDELFPYYVELCSGSQIKIKTDKGLLTGGIGGHAVLYMKGVCRDEEAPYPQLKVCLNGPEDAGGITNRDAGTGISVDKQFRNVNWVAVEGAGIFIDGYISDVSELTKEYKNQVIDLAAGRRLFKGIELHPMDEIVGTTDDDILDKKMLDVQGETDEQVIAQKTIGTDYALKYGRTLACTKLPILPQMLTPMVQYLNELNQKYAEPNLKDGSANPNYRNYKWSGLFNNCTHTAVNALAAAGIVNHIDTDLSPVKQLVTNAAIPGNQFVLLSKLGTDPRSINLSSPASVFYSRQPYINIFTQYDPQGWLPFQPGSLATYYKHKENEAYAQTDFFVDLKSLKSVTSSILKQLHLNYTLKLKLVIDRLFRIRDSVEKRLRKPEVVNLDSNLLHFADRHSKALKYPAPTLGSKDYKKFEKTYYSYLKKELNSVCDKIKKSELSSPACKN